MKKILASFTTLIVLLTMFVATASAAGSSGGSETVAASSSYDGPLTLLSLITLAIMIYLPLTDNN